MFFFFIKPCNRVFQQAVVGFEMHLTACCETKDLARHGRDLQLPLPHIVAWLIVPKVVTHPLDSFSFSCYIFSSNRNETVS